MTTIHNLIFDLDGTLIDSSDGVVEAVNYSLQQVGQPQQSPEAIKPFIGYPLETMYPHFTDAPLDKLLEHFRVKAVETIVVSTSPLAGVEEVLSLLQAEGFKMAIATTKIRMHIDGILAKLGWELTFSATVAGDEVSRVKPDPEALELALMRLHARADETLMIGDTINDVLAARAVPMKVVAVASPYGMKNDLVKSEADHHIKSVADLPGLLNGFRR